MNTFIEVTEHKFFTMSFYYRGVYPNQIADFYRDVALEIGDIEDNIRYEVSIVLKYDKGSSVPNLHKLLVIEYDWRKSTCGRWGRCGESTHFEKELHNGRDYLPIPEGKHWIIYSKDKNRSYIVDDKEYREKFNIEED